jgi:hypothetical protein
MLDPHRSSTAIALSSYFVSRDRIDELSPSPQLLDFNQVTTENACCDATPIDNATVTFVIDDVPDPIHAMRLSQNVGARVLVFESSSQP